MKDKKQSTVAGEVGLQHSSVWQGVLQADLICHSIYFKGESPSMTNLCEPSKLVTCAGWGSCIKRLVWTQMLVFYAPVRDDYEAQCLVFGSFCSAAHHSCPVIPHSMENKQSNESKAHCSSSSEGKNLQHLLQVLNQQSRSPLYATKKVEILGKGSFLLPKNETTQRYHSVLLRWLY